MLYVTPNSGKGLDGAHGSPTTDDLDVLKPGRVRSLQTSDLTGRQAFVGTLIHLLTIIPAGPEARAGSPGDKRPAWRGPPGQSNPRRAPRPAGWNSRVDRTGRYRRPGDGNGY